MARNLPSRSLVLLAWFLASSCSALGGMAYDANFLLQRTQAGLKTRSVKVADVQMSFVEGGDGVPIVMLHGFSADKSNWFAFAQDFTDHYRVIAPDLPPFGDSSDRSAPSNTVEGHVTHLHALVQALKLPRFHLVGNSMGGHTAALYTARHPEQVITLALVDAAGVDIPYDSDGARMLKKGVNGFVVRTPAEAERFFDLLFVDKPVLPPPVTEYFTQKERARAKDISRWFDEYLQNWVSLEPLLPGIQQPTLVLWGDGDRVLHPSAADVFRKRIPNTELVMVKGCGHVPMIERPAETAAAYQRFLLRHAALR